MTRCIADHGRATTTGTAVSHKPEKDKLAVLCVNEMAIKVNLN